MHHSSERPPSAKGGPSGVSFVAGDGSQTTKSPAPTQAQKPCSAAVEAALERHHNRLLGVNSPPPAEQEASRNMLRDAVYDAAADAINYLEGVKVFVACDDQAGLQYCTSKFVLFAREIAKGCRGIIGPDNTGASP